MILYFYIFVCLFEKQRIKNGTKKKKKKVGRLLSLPPVQSIDTPNTSSDPSGGP